jgi:hypothetical protein
MVLAAATRDKLVISADDLAIANKMVTDLEGDMPAVFSKIGRTDLSVQTERLVSYVKQKGAISVTEVYRYVHAYFPSNREFIDVIDGCIRSGQMRHEQRQGEMWLIAAGPEPMAKVIELPKAAAGGE